MTDVAAVAQLSEEDLHRLFEARTVSAFEDAEVTEDQRRAIYELTKMGPTAFNSQPLRIVWVSQGEARDRLVSHMMPGNQPKTAAAPMTAILAVDETWHHKFDRFLPARPQMGQMYREDEELAQETGRSNAFIQVGYFVMAVRAVGLAAGPMTGFDAAGLDADLLAGTGLKSLVVVNIGRGKDPEYGRGPRYSYDDATLTL
ncbi:malonic semialdehyde reductase [Rothia kristinae]|uniref:Malonic semialdehyde reductase n=1 Tax=Rothia kristinae TaxID=37923 RepID=A0A7T4MV32_9MICC|nr:malonic semialdehyde reductase [Rothia kristinae]SIM86576.1 Putative NADH dehydrogenase/NAD(P)H nitroreductase [Mycobacteroides abscessus subsp. abscessus]MBG7586802.1 malonic semialdehyde reductase [Rothia kristinae]MCA1169878.1 malonic semialdehyde reductase [Rothia kristinae]MCT1356350.1 malonic semialdehyde reductase [Rothia kristinae]MCT1393557.1 malonic semialdehyde reductase [Rothia kristinae]